ncbi:MAG: HAMP domain-containing histidine kinase [Chitinophagaceae bacterium]|nr:HAMP domain-containing histidine kinase [Chitinophagaceae bacterium]MCW5905132.1 HAMP domain-containing histidine kinase [Chitinophagaceae bacterium]
MSKLIAKIKNAGVTEEMDFVAAKRIKTFNLTAIFGSFTAALFLIINYNRERYILVSIDIVYILTLYLLIFFHFKRKYTTGFLITTITLALAFTVSSLLYKDGMDFFLLLIITMNLIFKTGKKNAFWAITIYSILFIAINIFNLYYTIHEDLGTKNRLENLIIWGFLQAIFLRYFGVLSTTYQREIENKNALLTEQQDLLFEKTKALEKSNAQLQEMNEAKEKIFSIIAHDVKAPITAIIGSLDLFNSNILTKEDFVALSKEMYIRMEQLKDNLDVLLEWSKSQMLGIEVKAEIFDIKKVIVNTINLFLSNIKFKKINIELLVDEDLLVYADPNHISLVIRNLINNAIKYSYAEGKIVIGSNKINKTVSIHIQDFGTGMDSATLHSLFNSININSQYGTSNERGTGLGLLLCKEFLEKNNGSIAVQSEKMIGSIFTFNLPSA